VEWQNCALPTLYHVATDLLFKYSSVGLEQEVKAVARNRKIRIIQFGKLDDPVLPILTVGRDVIST
jgi:hypothetical protein